MQALAIFSGIFTALYGILNAFAGFAQLRAKKIQTWAAWFMFGSGLILLAGGYMLMQKMQLSLLVVGIGLVAIHIVTINNGLHMYGRINPGHHLLRLHGLGIWNQA